jgi:RND family efflux transporter MFP subunit
MRRRVTQEHPSFAGNRFRRPRWIGASLALAAVVAGCGHEPRPAREPEPAGEPIHVTVVVPDSGAGGDLVLPGRVKALQEATVVARLSGRLSVLLAREGERVRAGQPLARFDAPESRRALEAARREWSAARAALDATARQAARFDSLLARGIASPRDRELVETEHRNAEARTAAAGSAIEALDAALAPRAPFAGVIGRRLVDAGEDVSPGTPLFEVRSDDGLEIVAAIPESALPGIAGARWEVEDAGGAWRPVLLRRLDGMTDTATRTRGARFTPGDPRAFEAGAFTRLRMRSEGLPGGAAWWLPASAIVRRGALRGAFVIAGDRAELRWLQLGDERDGAVEIQAGLRPGERVASEASGLTDGARIRTRP